VSNPVITGSGTSGTTDFQNGVRIKKGTAISIDLDAIGSNIFAGGPSNDDGDIVLYQKGVSDIRDTGKAALHLDAGASKIIIRDANFKVRCQIDGKNSDLNLFSQNQRSTIFLDGSAGNCWIGGNGQDGDLVGLSAGATFASTTELSSVWSRVARYNLDSGSATLWMGGAGKGGTIRLFSSTNTNINDSNASTIRLDGEKGFGTFLGDLRLKEGGLWIENGGISLDQGSIKLKKGDVILEEAADCAEEFDIDGEISVDPGSIMALSDREGCLRLSDEEYDKKVVGVVSGAGSYKPGLLLDKKPSIRKRVPISLIGKVLCKADARYEPIKKGDLLTTSNTPGHAMKAVDQSKSFGATIGKALRSMPSGRGLIPVLVSLQ
jgi:hypothetical protein